VGLERYIRTRRALAAAPPAPEEEEEEPEEVVAGIRVGRASVPRWLYGFYVLIPVFAFLYVVNNVALAPVAEEAGKETAAPTGPVTELTIVASGIKFDLETITFPAQTEVTVTFENRDAGVPHDFTVWRSEAAATAGDEAAKIAESSLITGVSETEVRFTTPDPGQYYFNCTVHPPSMFGTVEVVAG
jgi:plastocyanin